MADDAPAADEVRKQIALTKKKPLAFALALGKKPEGTVLLMHRTKAAEALLKQARKIGETPKLAFGEISTEGTQTTFKCEKDPNGPMAKQLKQYFRSINVKRSVIFLGPDGEVLDSDIDDDVAEDVETSDKPNPQQEAWESRKAELAPALAKMLKAGQGDISKVRAVWSFAQEKSAEGDFARALKAADMLEGLIAQAGQTEATATPQAKAPGRKALAQSKLLWTQSVGKMRKELERLKAEIIKAETEDEDNEPEDLKDLQAKIADIQTYLDPFDGRLEIALTDAVDAPDVEQQAQKLEKCRGILNDFSNHLKDPFFDAVDTENGYVDVAISSTARTSISAIQKILS
ncbi:hypothetical protein DL239_02245 [Sedimentitalea sp. CY04]|uniref:Defence against restriction A N-terminal domain-containing protein n=1 Tax=Parasedimentitalea denitrificans TaxID=2211118 RepID=A0ABX0W6H8_9RHOB|nr:hypothetical protein [Sedimentitalea sp. CY04]NIZ59791.1 hypothetical protein [Sedimentitalea sp. CY04]